MGHCTACALHSACLHTQQRIDRTRYKEPRTAKGFAWVGKLRTCRKCKNLMCVQVIMSKLKKIKDRDAARKLRGITGVVR